MIKSFKNKQLEIFYKSGIGGSFIDPTQRKKVLRKLDAMDKAEKLDDLRTPSNRLHKVEGCWTITIAKHYPYRIFFEWNDGNIETVDWRAPH